MRIESVKNSAQKNATFEVSRRRVDQCARRCQLNSTCAPAPADPLHRRVEKDWICSPYIEAGSPRGRSSILVSGWVGPCWPRSYLEQIGGASHRSAGSPPPTKSGGIQQERGRVVHTCRVPAGQASRSVPRRTPLLRPRRGRGVRASNATHAPRLLELKGLARLGAGFSPAEGSTARAVPAPEGRVSGNFAAIERRR